jgi:glycosyltransferase involved in cell wall biosynthesis
VRKLVAKIQKTPIPVSWELLVFDDGSEEQYKVLNQSIASVPEVQYQEMPSNMGRSAIRNKLAEVAKGDLVLFLDDDCIPVHADFFRQYIHAFDKAEVLCGGHVYPKEAEEGYELHHFVGQQSEVKTAMERSEQPYAAFHSSNFCIKRSLFLETKFDERLTQYGHEDTLFGFELGRKKTQIKHLDNPVLHEGIQSNTVFLDKTEKALENLVKLYRDFPDLKKRVKLLSVFQRLRRLGVLPLLKAYFRFSGKSMRQQLEDGKLSLGLYNQYKLVYFASHISKHSKI